MVLSIDYFHTHHDLRKLRKLTCPKTLLNMKEILLIVILISFPFLGSSQIQLDHGQKNEFGFYYYKDPISYKLYIDSAYKGNRINLSETFIPFYVKKKGVSCKRRKVVIGTNSNFLDTRYGKTPVSLIPDVIELSSEEYEYLKFEMVDEKIYRRINKMDRKLFFTEFIYPGSNIIKREIDQKTLLAVMFRIMSEGMILYRNELSGDLELPQGEYHWRSPYE